MTPAQRREHSERMKAMWAQRRANGTAQRKVNRTPPLTAIDKVGIDRASINRRLAQLAAKPKTAQGSTNGTANDRFVLVLPDTHGYELTDGTGRLLVSRDDLKTIVATLIAAL